MPLPQRKLSIACPHACSLHPERIGAEKAEALKAIRENGAGANIFTRQAKGVLGYALSSGTVSRHLKHYRDLAPEVAEAPGGKVSDVGLLELIIKRGVANSGSWRPSLRDVMDAMKLKMQLTGASAFEDMLSAMNVALDLEDDELEPVENPDAVFSVDELPTDDAEDLAEPLA